MASNLTGFLSINLRPVTVSGIQMNPSVFDHVPVQIVAVVLGVFLTGLVGIMVRLHNQVAQQSTRLAAIEAELLNSSNAREAEKERAQDLWERVERHIDNMESRLESQIKEMSLDVKSLVKEMHSEFLRCPNHRAHGAGGF